MNDSNKKPIVWTIGYSDSSSGTGIQSDLQTFNDFGVYGCNVITAIKAQNTFASGYTESIDRKGVVAQINALDSDLPAKVIKVGVLPHEDALFSVVKYLQEFDGRVVYDAELDASDNLLEKSEKIIKQELLPCVDWLVVNTEEARQLTGIVCDSSSTIASAATQLLAYGAKSVLITGAKLPALDAKRIDYWSDGSSYYWIGVDAHVTANNRGGGAVLSAALAAAIAMEKDVEQSLNIAKAYVTRGIKAAVQIGSGPGTVAHAGLPADTADYPAISIEPFV